MPPCCASIIITAMTSGWRSDEVVSMARSVTGGSALMASCSSLISSNSSRTSSPPLSHLSACSVRSSSSRTSNRYLGDSGHSGRVKAWVEIQ